MSKICAIRPSRAVSWRYLFSERNRFVRRWRRVARVLRGRYTSVCRPCPCTVHAKWPIYVPGSRHGVLLTVRTRENVLTIQFVQKRIRTVPERERCLFRIFIAKRVTRVETNTLFYFTHTCGPDRNNINNNNNKQRLGLY